MEISECISLIQQGQNEYMIVLWGMVKGLIARWALRYCAGRRVPGGVELDDLMQCGFLAMVEAVQGYDPEKGGFNTYLHYHVKKQFRDAIGRTDRQLRDPLNHCISLDIPVDEDDPDGKTFLDVVPDPRDSFAGVEKSIFREQLHKALETALDSIPAREAQALRAEYWRGLNQTETAAEMGVTDERVRQLRNGGLRHIRNSSARVMLEKFIDYQTPFYKKVSVVSFNRTRTSAVEAVMLFREKMRCDLGKGLCTT